MPMTKPRVVDVIGDSLIVAYREPTQALEASLRQAGCQVQVLRQVHQPEYRSYSRSFLCLLNHQQAWRRAAASDRPTLIVEADFVPVRQFGDLPVPFDPKDNRFGIAWLYTCAPQVYRVSGGYGIGYSTAMVAYIVSPDCARALIELADAVAIEPGPKEYSPWDSGIDYFLRDRKFHNYVPFRNYGEHGGIPNPEHSRYQTYKLSRTHRADILYGALAFSPLYAADETGRTRWIAYLKERSYGRIKGLGRLLLGKYLRWPVLISARGRWRLAWFALQRQITVHW